MTTILDQRLDRLAGQIDGWMRPYVDTSSAALSSFYGMMAYHLGWAARDGSALARPAATGKRLRPALAVLTCEAHGGDTEAARGPAVAVELIHNFSLVHDDIQDRSEHRRGRETVWHVWGAPQAINVGDALFALAQLALVDERGRFPEHRVAEAVRHLNRTCLRLVEGQFLDLHLESVNDVGLPAYEQMVSGKTAALIEGACLLGAIAADADEAAVAACGRFGHELGLAFQFQDDLLGVWGDPALTGKPIGADIRSRKKGLPMVLALDLARGSVHDRLELLVAGREPMSDADIAQVLAIMDELGVHARAAALVAARFETVERALRAALPPGRESDLLALCSRLRGRAA